MNRQSPRQSRNLVLILVTACCLAGCGGEPPKSKTESNDITRPKVATQPKTDELAAAMKATDGDLEAALKKIEAYYFLNSDKKIEWVDLSDKKVGLEGIKHLTVAKDSLRRLTLNGTYITDETLKMLVAQHPALTKLQLNQTPITDDGIAHLKSLKNLRELEIRATNIGDAGMSHIAEMPQLRLLSLSFTKVSETGFSQLSKLSEMRKLLLQDTAASDEIFNQLSKLNRLEFVDLTGTKVTKAATDQFRNAHKHITVRSAFP